MNEKKINTPGPRYTLKKVIQHQKEHGFSNRVDALIDLQRKWREQQKKRKDPK